ncbi:hypothetical protein GA0115255_123207 [Streptomyces sp. Ncost-T6T-2b]|nr:hypothetical protein GA0115255_123207 [Streptomyces sp. Ncost-T6T-2b]
MSILARSPSGGPHICCAVVRGMTMDRSRSGMRWVSSKIPTTVKALSPMKRAGRVRSVLIPRRAAVDAPTTATGWLWSSWKAS